jgi:methionyl aminopeptidase
MGFLATLFGCGRTRSSGDEEKTAAATTAATASMAAPTAERVVPRGVGPTPEAETARIAPIVSGILAELGRSVRPGLRTKELETQAIALLRAADLDPRMLGFRGFPAAIAVSVDDEVLHGIPSARTLESGQLVKIQIGARTLAGTADQGWTFAVGELSPATKRLREAGVAALRDAVATIRATARTGDVGAAIQGTLEAAGFSAIRDFVGYGVGAKPMQSPQLPCFGVRGSGARLRRDALLHVHVIGAAGEHALELKPDRWTAVTKDGRPGVLVTAVVRVQALGCDVLTPLLA